ncbi:carbohydrate ABC transporter permease [Falsiroseomonas sp.]|uniref:carbohydrate ABC transporter permease n=1 Tax=Falsiroseomonas sp. TaxID=2870721 RepID=UPI0034A3AF14
MRDVAPLTLTPPWRALGNMVLFLASLSIVVPLLLVIATSLKPAIEIHGGLPWPQSPTGGNYLEVFDKIPLGLYFWNSVATTSLRVGGQLVIALLAAYAFARFEFRGRDLLFALTLGAMMLPHSLTFLPTYLMISWLGWFDTWWGLIVPNLAAPVGVFLLRQHMLAFPRDLLDAAAIDGAGPWRALWLVILPNIQPALAAIAILLFIDCWNEYFWPLVITESEHAMTVQIGIRRFLDAERGDDLGPLMAGVVLVSLPAMAVFLWFQRRILETFVSAGLKG